MLKIGLLGTGHLGKIHLKLLKTISEVQLVGFFDQNPDVAKKVSEEFDVQAFPDLESLVSAVDAVDIVTPTISHFECASYAISQGKHIFIEKPLTHTLREAEQLIEMLAQQPHLIAQVGHVERFNPAFLSVSDQKLSPMFIEGHRLALYNPRGTDVSVVLDLMIHDLDIILSMVDSPIKHISASGVAVISDTPDIANARIEFENGCVANLTASRISVKNMRRLRMFQKNTYMAVDFLEKKAEVFRIAPGGVKPENKMFFEFDSGTEKKFLIFEQPEIGEVNSIKMELEEFTASILHGNPVRVSIRDGYYALKTAYQIIDSINDLAGRVLG